MGGDFNEDIEEHGTSIFNPQQADLRAGKAKST